MGSIESLRHLGPVNNLPDFGHEVWSHIHVVKVVGVLPDVDVDDGHEIGAHVGDKVLVGSGSEGE